MAQYATLKAAIDAVIKANGQREITGTVLNQTLNAMVNSLGADYQFAGVATPSTNPGTPDQNVFYLAFEDGTYTNFNATVLSAGISILMWDGSWSSQTFYTIDATPTASSNNLVSSGAVFDAIKTNGSAYDVSAHFPTGGPNSDGKFTLEYILSNADTLIPTAWRKGGMSIRFVSSSDNKYVQYILTNDSFTTNVNKWQGLNVSNNNNIIYLGEKPLVYVRNIVIDPLLAKAIVDGYMDFGTSGKTYEDFTIKRIQKPAQGTIVPTLFYELSGTTKVSTGTFVDGDENIARFSFDGIDAIFILNWQNADYIAQYNIYAIGDGVTSYQVTSDICIKTKFDYYLNDFGIGTININAINNFWSYYGNTTIAREAVPVSKRKLGLTIVYKKYQGWVKEQYVGVNLSGWTSDENWEDLSDGVVLYLEKQIVDGYVDFRNTAYSYTDLKVRRIQMSAQTQEMPTLFYTLNGTENNVTGKFINGDKSVCKFVFSGITAVFIVNWENSEYISQYNIYAIGDGSSNYPLKSNICVKGTLDYFLNIKETVPAEINGMVVDSVFYEEVIKASTLNQGQYNQKVVSNLNDNTCYAVCIETDGKFSGQINVIYNSEGIWLNKQQVINGQSFASILTIKRGNFGIAWKPENTTDVVTLRIFKMKPNRFSEKYDATTQVLCNPHIITHPDYTYDYFCDVCKHPNGELYVTTTTATDALHEDYNAGFLAIRKTYLGRFDVVDFIKVSNSVNEGGHDIDGVHYGLAGCPQVVNLNNGNIACRFSLYQQTQNTPYLFYREYDVENNTLGTYIKMKVANENGQYVDFSRDNLVNIFNAIYGIDLTDAPNHLTIDMMSIDKDRNDNYYFALTVSSVDVTSGGSWVHRPTPCVIVKSSDFANWEIIGAMMTEQGGSTLQMLPISETAIAIVGTSIYIIARSDEDSTQYFGVMNTSGGTIKPFVKVPYLSGQVTSRIMYYQNNIYVSGNTKGTCKIYNPPYNNNEVICLCYNQDAEDFTVAFTGLTPNNAHPFEVFNFHNSVYAIFTGDARHIEPVSSVSETDIEIVPIPNNLLW